MPSYKWDFNSCAIRDGFCKSSYIIIMCICLILGHKGLVSVSHFSDASSFISVHDRLHILQEGYSS